jgi:Omp85 superfamily domain
VVQYPGSSRIHVYDDRNNVFKTSRARFHLSSDSANHAFDYFNHEINKKGFIPDVFYNDEDRVYIGLRYGFTNHKWRRQPYATKQLITLHYSLLQKAFSVTYAADYPNVIGKWNLSLLANYDAIRWTNFFGLGNETILPVYDQNFYRIQTREWLGKLGINRQFGKSTVSVSGFVQNIKIIADTERYVGKVFLNENNNPYKPYSYAGAQLQYSFVRVNDSIVPTSGIVLIGNASYFSSLEKKQFFQKYLGKIQFYIPMGNKFSLAIKAGGSTVLGKAEALNTANFYEHAIVGGPVSLRGFRRERFWGQSGVYNTNDLRFITNIRTHWLYAKAGLLVFFDEGRVWMPNENSNTLHTSYGGGIIFAPFRRISATVTYGISNEARLVQATVYKIFK